MPAAVAAAGGAAKAGCCTGWAEASDQSFDDIIATVNGRWL